MKWLPPLPDVRVLTLVAGPNGSGKSTLTAALFPRGSVTVIDPDAMARELNPEHPDHAAAGAARQAIRWRRALIARRESFVVETTLSGHGVFPLLQNAIEAGYQIHLIYVALRDPELQIERVRLRALQGGHSVPDSDIRRRYERSLYNAPKVMRMAHFSHVYDNSATQWRPVLRVQQGRVLWHAASLPSWARRIQIELESVQ